MNKDKQHVIFINFKNNVISIFKIKDVGGILQIRNVWNLNAQILNNHHYILLLNNVNLFNILIVYYLIQVKVVKIINNNVNHLHHNNYALLTLKDNHVNGMIINVILKHVLLHQSH